MDDYKFSRKQGQSFFETQLVLLGKIGFGKIQYYNLDLMYPNKQ